MINGQQQGNPVNEPKSSGSPKRSKFDLSHNVFNTLRYGEITPFLVMESVPTDKISVRNDYDIRTLTMANPILSHLKMNKDFYNIPMESILPFNWEKIYTNPVIGDDVPIDANCVSQNFFSYLSQIAESCSANIRSALVNINVEPSDGQSVEDWQDSLDSYFNTLLLNLYFLEMFFSNGSLINSLGFKLSACYHTNTNQNGLYNGIDRLFDSIHNQLLQLGSSVQFTIGDTSIRIRNRKDLRRAVSLARTEFFSVNVRPNANGATKSILNIIKSYENLIPQFFVPSVDTMPSFNFSRLIAYQLVCSHFYSNDKIDYIYSADLFRQLVSSYINSSFGFDTFTYNGISINYDYLSGHYFDKFLIEAVTAFSEDFPITFAYNYFALFFSYKNSLKYKDYFTGSRSNPLAVGDTNIPVTADNVSVLDITRKIQIQRFLNNVNKTGRKFSEYIQGLFGESVGYDYHNPAFLSHSSDYVDTHEIQNTGNYQSDPNAMTSMVKSSSGKFEFTFDSDRPSIVLGVCWFDVRRVYHKANDKSFFYRDRFDMFNPYMQYIGDQSVTKPEIDLTLGNNGNFAYQSRYQEYKEIFDRACGAFAYPFDEVLPSWLFLADDFDTLEHIKPSYIRSRNDEFDKFFENIAGWSLGSYFHFILVAENSVTAVRPMSVHPQIL